VVAEGHPVRVNLAQGGQAEYLEATGIGEDGAIPAHEAVQPAQVADEFVAGAQVEMVGVGQHQADAQLAQFARLDSLDSCLCANRREDRRGNGAMRRMQHAGAGHSLSCQQFERERHHPPRAGCYLSSPDRNVSLKSQATIIAGKRNLANSRCPGVSGTAQRA
jgi:hypothetical protein